MGILGGVPVSGFVSPSAEADTYPAHWAKYGKGGHRSVDTIADMNAITAERSEEGMTTYVKATASTYILNASNAWELFVQSTPNPGLTYIYETLADRDAVATSTFTDAEQVFVEETSTYYKYNGALDQFDEFLVLDYYAKADVDQMMLSAAVGLKYSIRDIALGDSAETQMLTLVPEVEGVLAILNDDAIWRWTKTSVDPDPETFEWQSFAVLSAGHTHSYTLLKDLPDDNYELAKRVYGTVGVTDEASVPVTKGTYYAETEKTLWKSDGVTAVNWTDLSIEANLDLVVPYEAGDAGKQLQVNTAEDGLEWVENNILSHVDIFRKNHTIQYQVAQVSDIPALVGMVAGEFVWAMAEDVVHKFDGTDWSLLTDYSINNNAKLSNLSDVNAAVLADGMALKYDGVNKEWKAVSPIAGISLSDMLKQLYFTKYVVVDIAERDLIADMVTNDLLHVTDDDEFYEFDGSAWVLRTDFIITNTFTDATPVPVAVGGISVGDTFSNIELAEVVRKILYPYQYPAFTAFTAAGIPSVYEVGDGVAAGDVSLSWSTSNSGNVAADSIGITDLTGAAIATGISNSGSNIYTSPSVVMTAPGFKNWQITGVNTNGDTFSRELSVAWQWRVYYGESVQTVIDEVDIKALRGYNLSNTPVATYNMLGGGYKWICYPTSMGLKTVFRDAATNFDIAMETPLTINVTNTHGVSTDYYAHRSFNEMGSTINIKVVS